MKSIFVLAACAISATIAAPMPLSEASVPTVTRSNEIDDIKNTIPEGAHLVVNTPTPSKPYWTWVWTWGTSPPPPPTVTRVVEATPSASPTSSSAPAASSTAASSSSSDSSLPGPVVDDYPEKYKNNCKLIDQWNLNACQCVSFVAWRVYDRLNQDFTRAFDDETWSNANTWSNAAKLADIEVNNTPAPGAIAQTNAGVWGHVAWVVAVDGDTMRIEEYNAMNPLKYDTRIVSVDSFENFIHIPMATPA